MQVSDLAAIAAEPNHASAARCRSVLRAVERVKKFLDEREHQWLARLADLDPAYDEHPVQQPLVPGWLEDDTSMPLAG